MVGRCRMSENKGNNKNTNGNVILFKQLPRKKTGESAARGEARRKGDYECLSTRDEFDIAWHHKANALEVDRCVKRKVIKFMFEYILCVLA